MDRAARIVRTLREKFHPAHLAVHNESALHQGHAGSPNSGESHYRIVMTAEAFRNLNRIARHRLIMETLAEEFRQGLHALALEVRAPGEGE